MGLFKNKSKRKTKKQKALITGTRPRFTSHQGRLGGPGAALRMETYPWSQELIAPTGAISRDSRGADRRKGLRTQPEAKLCSFSKAGC
ncbi:MAG: hypothetical protein A3B86_03455 [Candidatus Yanofskybacteria bacterium RIFCSPHIGHO2_02_FULL_38_22b]|uniref:Uncharacterized protein n=1 Tax=Candidatus Yanofskybacteria bacterium RIFCSPHIGHO2_02_FULL_38_22b TaxID=1802673 RepID=A0A1F8F2K4_9BACT|nr:MAG: hypothetical protein A3B86_03455 [Candidatus Yanofskybacteria bacterium RIFCSPHIGHO2_02_FULL_38_22b]